MGEEREERGEDEGGEEEQAFVPPVVPGSRNPGREGNATNPSDPDSGRGLRPGSEPWQPRCLLWGSGNALVEKTGPSSILASLQPTVF